MTNRTINKIKMHDGGFVSVTAEEVQRVLEALKSCAFSVRFDDDTTTDKDKPCNLDVVASYVMDYGHEMRANAAELFERGCEYLISWDRVSNGYDPAINIETIHDRYANDEFPRLVDRLFVGIQFLRGQQLTRQVVKFFVESRGKPMPTVEAVEDILVEFFAEKEQKTS